MRSSPFQFALLTVGAAAAAYARTTVSPLQESMGRALALTDNQVALLQGPALAIPLVLAAVPLGLLIDRYSRARLLCLFAVIDCLATGGSALATSFWILFLARCLVGLMVTAISTTSFSLLSDMYPPDQRGRASMVVVIGQFGGMSAAFAFGSWLLQTRRFDEAGWRWAMLCLTLPLLIVSLLTVFMREPARTGVAVANPSLRQTWEELRRMRGILLPLGAGIVAAEIAVMAVLTWTAPVLSRSFALSADRIGAIIAAGLLTSGVIGPLGGGAIADFCQRSGGPRRTLMALTVLALLSIPVGLYALMPGVGMAAVLFVLFMVNVGAIVVTGTALFTVIIPNELRGLCMASLAAACALFGVGLGPLAVSVLADIFGSSGSIAMALACICAGAALLGAAMFAWGGWCLRVAGHDGTSSTVGPVPT
jgi:MFS family permease